MVPDQEIDPNLEPNLDPDQVMEDRNRRRLLAELSPDINIQRGFLLALAARARKRKK
jgi:hypothetical protein